MIEWNHLVSRNSTLAIVRNKNSSHYPTLSKGEVASLQNLCPGLDILEGTPQEAPKVGFSQLLLTIIISY